MASNKAKVCVFGDSICKGVVFDANRQKYVISSAPFPSVVADGLGVTLNAFCRFGCTVTKGAETVMKHRDRLGEYKYTVLEYGGNDSDFAWDEVAASPESFHDCHTPLDRFIATYEDIISIVRQSGSSPVLVNMAPVDSARYFRTISKSNDGNAVMLFLGEERRIEHWNEMYNNAVWAVAARCGCPVLDIRSPLLFERGFGDYFCDDGIHPNDEGHRLIADSLLRSLEGSADRLTAV